jgi:C1A family cysteine protease
MRSQKRAVTVFIFKNSWGVKWGQAGYGVVTHEYLDTNLQSAVVLEVRTAKAD